MASLTGLGPAGPGPVRHLFPRTLDSGAAATLLLTVAAASGNVPAADTAYTEQGLYGGPSPVRTITSKVESNLVTGSTGITFTAAGASIGTSRFTYLGLNAGPAAYVIDMGTREQTSWTINCTARLNGTVEDVSERTFSLVSNAVLSASTVPNIGQGSDGSSALTFAVRGAAGMAATAALTFTVTGFGLNWGLPIGSGAGRIRTAFTATAVGEPTWPRAPTTGITFAALAGSEAAKEAGGASALTFGASAGGYQPDAASGTAAITFGAAARAGFTRPAYGLGTLTFAAQGVNDTIIGATVLGLLQERTELRLRQETTTLRFRNG